MNRVQQNRCERPLVGQVSGGLANGFRGSKISLVWGLVILLGANSFAEEPRGGVPLIFDTDIGNDVDDVLALGVIHALQSRGECELLAVTITKDHEAAASFTDAVNTFYGRGEIPVGVCRSGVTPEQGKFIGLGGQQDRWSVALSA